MQELRDSIKKQEIRQDKGIDGIRTMIQDNLAEDIFQSMK
jgi:hypothetical protein